MVQKSVTVTNPTGLHTRPGHKFVLEAKKFQCSVKVKKAEKEVDAKSILKLLKLGISQNDEIELVCDGSDEAEAIKALEKFIVELIE